MQQLLNTHQQQDVQYRHNEGDGIEHKGAPLGVGVLSHHLLRRGKADLQEHGERQLEAEHHLRNDESVERIVDEEDDAERQTERQQHTHARVDILDVVRLAEDTCKDGTRRHTAGNGRGYTCHEQCQREDDACRLAQQRCEQRLCLLQFVHRCVGLEEGGSRQKYHGAVDGPPYQHGEQGIVEFVLQTLLYLVLVLLVVFMTLDNLGMQEEVVA